MEALGEHSWKRLEAERHDISALERTVVELRGLVDRFARERGEAEAELERVRGEYASVVLQLQSTERELLATSGKLAAAHDEASEASDRRARAEAELAAYRSRLSSRLIDVTPISGLWRALRRAAQRVSGERPVGSASDDG